ncbi:MAG: hypothetical protein KJ015_09885 [Myxococcales bacterium]|nr:hypothetical protein [Myxococcales bacterium]
MSANDWGAQYPKDDPFKARARLHQSRFRADVLGLDEYRDYGNRLSTRDALAGRNFYGWPGVVEAAAARYGRKDSPVWHDMLRSEHIPFNLFVPLRDLPWGRILFGEWLGSPVSAVTQILVEWAPKPRRAYLNDNTSFDTWVECRLEDGRRAGIGIEVKYTEGPYSWGKTERARMFDEGSLYHQVHRRAGLYAEGALNHLRTRALKQLWRNQLLGAAMLARSDRSIDVFTSVLVYPAGNAHYAKAAREYGRLLDASARPSFGAVTFEGLMAAYRKLGGSGATSQRWVEYLEHRYLVPP